MLAHARGFLPRPTVNYITNIVTIGDCAIQVTEEEINRASAAINIVKRYKDARKNS